MKKVRAFHRFCLALFLILWAWPARGQALPSGSVQDAEIRLIRELYSKTNESIRLARTKNSGEAGPLYCNEVVTNRFDGSWRAVGNYSRKAAFWYSDQPEFAPYQNAPEESVLVKVEVQETAAVRSLAEEYLFDKGELVFYFRRSKAVESTPVEERFYFRGKTLLRRLGVPADGAFEPTDPILVLTKAKTLQKSFLATFDR
jgi:hypothetical protein